MRASSGDGQVADETEVQTLGNCACATQLILMDWVNRMRFVVSTLVARGESDTG